MFQLRADDESDIPIRPHGCVRGFELVTNADGAVSFSVSSHSYLMCISLFHEIRRRPAQLASKRNGKRADEGRKKKPKSGFEPKNERKFANVFSYFFINSIFDLTRNANKQNANSFRSFHF